MKFITSPVSMAAICLFVLAPLLTMLFPPDFYYPSVLRAAHTDMRGKRVLVTGSSLGIGRELARRYASAGVGHVVLVARSEGRLQQVRSDILYEWEQLQQEQQPPQPPPAVHVLPADLSTEDRCAAVIESAVHMMDLADGRHVSGGLDYLVLNHITASHYGLWFDEPHKDLAVTADPRALPKPHPYVEEMFRVNTLSYIWLATAAVPHLQTPKHAAKGQTQQSERSEGPPQGHIVVISSLAGKTGIPHTALYAATKHALHGFFDSLRVELNAMRVPVRVLMCVIGATNTAGTAEVQTMVSRAVVWEDPAEVADSVFRHALLHGLTEMYYPHRDIYIASLIGQLWPQVMERILALTMHNHAVP